MNGRVRSESGEVKYLVLPANLYSMIQVVAENILN